MYDDSPARNETTVVPVRFECNGANAQVMTAFALGPKDKAIVVTQFLDQALLWRQDNKTRCQAFKKSYEAVAKVQKEKPAQQAVVRSLLEAAEKETRRTLKILDQQSNDRPADETMPQWLESHPDVEAALMRPYVLLMGVRLLASQHNNSDAEKKHLQEQETRIASLLNDRLRGSSLVAVAANDSDSGTDTDPMSQDNNQYLQLDEEFQIESNTYTSASLKSLTTITHNVVQANEERQRNIDDRQFQRHKFFEQSVEPPVITQPNADK